jgi:murein DD-endopeptidase MepM/ murein hydrolase activator NlpD
MNFNFKVPIKSLFKNLRHKYKFVVLDQDTLEEKFTFRLSRYNVFIAAGSIAIVSVILTLLIIGSTPLKNYIPGYASVDQLKLLIVNQQKVDSLEKKIAARDLYLQNLKETVLQGKESIMTDTGHIPDNQATDYSNLTLSKSEEDSLLRLEWEQKSKYDLIYYSEKPSIHGISSMMFFTPIKGTLVNGFNIQSKHYGVDIVAQKDAPIKATLDGTVIISTWTYEWGYVIGIQHSLNVISFYKHNSALLKRVGDVVSAGDPIAIIGNSGEQTSGPHLHFEIWYDGRPVNPLEFISFQ